MATLNDAHRAFIVDQLACFSSLDEIEKALKDVFGVDVPKSTILRYDPTTVQGERELAEKWKTAFTARRKAFLEDVSAIPIANKAVRLRKLDALANSPLVMKNPVQLRATIEQAAKEANNFYAPRAAEGNAGKGEGVGGDTDADSGAAERAARVDELRDSLRERRDREAAEARAARDHTDPAEAGGGAGPV